MLFAFIVRLGLPHEDAEDVLQEVFIKIYKNLYKYNSKWCFSTWIYSIALNTFKSEYKKRKKTLCVVFDETYMSTVTIDSPEAQFENKEIRNEIITLINDLDIEQRASLILKHVQGMSYKEISEILNVSPNAAKMKVLRAKQTICKNLEKSKKRGVIFEM